jgi:hypothetical protein
MRSTMLTVLTPAGSTSVDATREGDRLLVDPADLPVALGWELKPEGLCRDDVCVPVRDDSNLRHADRVDLVVAADLLGSTLLVSEEPLVAALSVPASERSRTLLGRLAADFVLPDLDGNRHSLEEFKDRKRLLVAFASW